jgi:hypothetical protein
VTMAEVDRLRRQNFGFRTLDRAVEPADLGRQIARYDPADAARVSAHLRAEAGLEPAVDRLLEIYAEALAAHVAADPTRETAEERATAAYLAWLNPYMKERGRLLIDREALWRRTDDLTAELAAAGEEVARLRRETADLRSALDEHRATATWRLYRRSRRLPR